MTTRASTFTAISVTAAVTTTSLVSYFLYKRALNRQISTWQEKRDSERKGRIRAEVKLRTALKQQQKVSSDDSHTMILTQIGTIVSPFTKRMGTPRQGALAPSSRGYIQFLPNIQPAALEGLQEYSHAWILFEFHANTDIQVQSKKSKIQPPRAPHKVGMLSTRSPHRPNPLGLSLVKIERVEKRRLYISALDLVNGTPVYDVKPCVPWDIPGYSNGSNGIALPPELQVPQWVSQHDALSQVEFAKDASDALKGILLSNEGISPAYDASSCETVDLVQNAISEVLAQDPRSHSKRGTTSDKPYNIMFGCAQVEFVVTSSGTVRVVGMHRVEFPDESFVDGIPLASEASQVA